MEEKEVVEKRTVRREEPLGTSTNVNVGPEGTTNVQQSGDDVVNLSQESDSASGDAVAGSQVTGVVNGVGGTTAVQATNPRAGWFLPRCRPPKRTGARSIWI